MTRVHVIVSCRRKTVMLCLVMMLAGVWTCNVSLAQDEDAASDLLGQMTELMKESGTAGNPDMVQNLSAILQSPDFQKLLKSLLASSDLSGLGLQNSGSPAGPQLLGFLPFSIVGMVVLVYAANLLLARILFAVNVFINARRLVSDKTPPLLMGPALWALAVVIGGMLVVILYWLMHHSTLSKLQQKS